MIRLDNTGLNRIARPSFLRATPLALLVASAAVLMGQAAHAQTAAPAAETESKATNALDSVTVTATRRREPVREVPMQVNVVPSEKLEREGAKKLADYIADQPGVNLTSSGTVGGSLSMRGLTTGPSQTIATVGVYIDDIATGMSSAYALGGFTPLDMGMLDLHHIEILRGPQGTLYGAGAMGGVLKYVTNQPDTTEFSGALKFGASSTKGGGSGFTTGATLNIPIKEDTAAVRLSAFSDRVGGSYNAVGPAAGSNIDRGHTEGGRFSLLLTPTRELTVRMTATSQEVSRRGLGFEDMTIATGRPVYGERTRFLYTGEPYKNRTTLWGLDVEYDFGWARLNSITSVQDVKISNAADISGAYVPFLRTQGLTAVSVPLGSNVDQHRTSQEFRLTSRSGQTFEWLAGLYLNRERGNVAGRIDANLPAGLPDMNLLVTGKPNRYQEVAAYGDITWNATSALSFTGGVRLAHNKQSYTDRNAGLLIGPVPSTGGGESSESPTTYLATAKYALDKTSNVYFRAASGYRPGGPNGLKPNTNRNLVKPMYESDSLWSYELGYKADLLNRTVSVEAALYDIEWKNIQQPIRDGGFGFFTNAGDARIKGAELMLGWKPTRDWNLHTSASLIDARLQTDAAGLQAKAGSRLPSTPRFAASAGVTRNFSLAGRDAYVGIAARYTGKRDAGYEGSTVAPSIKLPAYTMVDLQAGIEFPRFSLAAYVRNLADKRGLVSAEVGVTSPTQALVALAPARTIGVTMTVPF
ncbi:TonB-dependent receptor [Variovorax boronicumulans]|uniref:TonB-dependent receptor n=1 Tax=Variovorax boronicumulans TaxID=436515 RepID=UPI001C55EA7D